MDFPFRHWAPIPRRRPFPLPVANTNFLFNKSYWIRRQQQQFSFAIVFKGDVEIRISGETFFAKAPCVYIVHPGKYTEHGPPEGGQAWDQLYFTYDAKYAPFLEQHTLGQRRESIWTAQNPTMLWALTEELCALSQASYLEEAVDRVDRLCERIIFEASLPEETQISEKTIIERILKKMQQDPKQPFDLSETARLAGMSKATFRRRWQDMVNEPPRRYHEQLRIREACRLLVETDYPIKDISRMVGFEDQLYFSRRFQERTLTSPTHYRLKHHP